MQLHSAATHSLDERLQLRCSSSTHDDGKALPRHSPDGHPEQKRWKQRGQLPPEGISAPLAVRNPRLCTWARVWSQPGGLVVAGVAAS